jgi:hypothetical protein
MPGDVFAGKKNSIDLSRKKYLLATLRQSIQLPDAQDLS